MPKVSKSLSLYLLCTGFLFAFACSQLQAQAVPPFVFAARNIQSNGNVFFPASSLLPGMGAFSRFKVVGGSLRLRESNGSVRTLVDSTMSFGSVRIIDVCSPCVFWDTTKILFAGVEHPDSSWRIYEIHTDGTGFRKITFTNRPLDLTQFGSIASMFQKYDDIDPVYLPDGRICFASSHYPSLVQYYGVRATNLYVMNYDGSDIHRITSDRNGAEKPTIDPITGRIVFSRHWYNFDRPSRLTWNGITRDSSFALTNDMANVWQCADIMTDGDAMGLYAGTGNRRLGLEGYRPRVSADGRMLSIFVPHTQMIYTSGSTGIRWYNKGADLPHYITGVNMDNMQLYVQNPPSTGTMQPPYATDPVWLPDGRVLFSYATVVENQDYGIFVINTDGTGMQSVYDTPGKMDLNAEPLVVRPVPPILFDPVFAEADELPPTDDPSTYFKNGGFRFDCANMFTNAPVDAPISDAPPITKNATIKFFLDFQRKNSFGLDTAILLDQRPVQYSGFLNLDFAPGDVPMFEQVVDSSGKVIQGTGGQISHVQGMNFGRSGTGTKCVGCHAGHTTITVPITVGEASFINTSTSAHVTQSSFYYVSDSVQYPGSRVIDRKARNDSLKVNWISNGSNNEWVQLDWDIPIDMRKIFLYNMRHNAANSTNIQVTDCEVFMYLQSTQVYHISSTGPIDSTGTRFDIAGIPKCDRLKVIVKSFTGLAGGHPFAGLAEIETNARISYYEIIGVKQISGIAEKFYLSQNYPNPFNPVTRIKYSIPKSAKSPYRIVRLSIYDITGRLVATPINQVQSTGTYQLDFDAKNLASGIYFYRLTAGDDFSEVKKMVLVK